MATIAIVKECLLSLGDRSGSSLYAINKWIEAEKQVGIFKGVFLATYRMSSFSASEKLARSLPWLDCHFWTKPSIDLRDPRHNLCHKLLLEEVGGLGLCLGWRECIESRTQRGCPTGFTAIIRGIFADPFSGGLYVTFHFKSTWISLSRTSFLFGIDYHQETCHESCS